MAGATLWATRLSGKLNGVMAPTTPRGTRSTKATLPSPAALAPEADGLAGVGAGHGGGEAERVDGARRLDPGGGDRLGGLLGDRPGELVHPGGQRDGRAVEHLGSAVGGQRPGAVAGEGRGHRCAEVGDGAGRHVSDLVVVPGRPDDQDGVVGVAVVDVLAADAHGRAAGQRDASAQRPAGTEVVMACTPPPP
ncbi:MAG: hypothetical protein R2726_03595 [Acidimicrobiales bacterium]